MGRSSTRPGTDLRAASRGGPPADPDGGRTPRPASGSSAMTVLAETSAEWFHIGRLCPLLWNEVGDLTVFVLGWELACEQCAKLRADADLDDRPCARVFAEDVVDRPLGVEERADRAAGQDPVTEVEAAGPKRLQI